MNPMKRVELQGADGLTLELLDLGCTWLSLRVPLADGTQREVILGCPVPEGYQRPNGFIGATIGRYANRIAHARIARDGRIWHLARDDASPHQLHGGPQGFHTRRWTLLDACSTSARWQLVSPDGDQGFPGTLRVEQTVELSAPGEITTTVIATVDAPSPVCITNHAYFNLDGASGACGDARRQTLQLNATHVQLTTPDLLPLGKPRALERGNVFDFRVAKPINHDGHASRSHRAVDGYDHAYLLQPECRAGRVAAAVLRSFDNRLEMQLSTTLAALQFYSGQHLAGIIAREGLPLGTSAGIALEPGFLPDSPNRAADALQPSCWLEPGQTYRHVTRHRFAAI
jgi:aldose 1-epimerase